MVACFILLTSEMLEAVEACMTNSDAVIHLAAQVSVPASVDNPKENWDVNVLGTANVLNTARKLGISRVDCCVFCCSVWDV